MANNRKLVKNSLFVTAGMAVGGALVFLAMVVMARYLGVADFGIFSTLLAVVSIIQLFADGGMVNITIRDIARQPHALHEQIGFTSLGLLGLSVAFITVISISLYFWGIESKLLYSFLFMLLAGFSALQGLIFGAAIRAREDMQVTAFIGVVHKAILAFGIWAVLAAGGGLIAVCAVNFVANLVQTLWLLFEVNKRYGRVQFRFQWARWKTIFAESLPLGASLVLRKLTVHLDILLLSVLATAIAVGLYSSAYRVLQLIETASIAFSGVMLPRLSQLAKQDISRFTVTFNHITVFLFAASVPLALWVWLSADVLVPLFYTSTYAEAAPALQVLGLALMALIPAALLHPAFAALGEQKTLMKLALISLALNTVLGVALILPFTYVGAAISTAITEAVVLVTGLIMLSRRGVTFSQIKKVTGVVLSGCFASLAYLCIPDFGPVTQMIAGTLCFAATYLAAIVMLRVYTIQDVRMLLKKSDSAVAAEVLP
ncbi:flippase [Alteromonas sp. H39]|uniref:flippase n=1 Tax=Alteromonas sp. H39 TaxID=3389876 RepID=UPI0039E04D18